jgi:hypothetical protein
MSIAAARIDEPLARECRRATAATNFAPVTVGFDREGLRLSW